MYQFYYSDKSKCLFRGLCKDNIRNYYNITAVRPTMWEEHCLECGAPKCYKSCTNYSARSDGCCKRFENGLLTFNDEKACCGQGVRLKFRQWGTMMTIIFPSMMTENEYIELKEKNEKFGNQLKKIESSSLPREMRWQSIRILEFLRRTKLRKLDRNNNFADAFIFHGYSYTENNYRLILEVYDGYTPVYKISVDIHYGENITIINDLSPVFSKNNCVVKVYPENNITAELDILWCDFVQGNSIVKEEPAEKVKCVVWDLDGTLWDGTLMECDNPETIVLKPNILQIIKELDRRGIIQSIASKNDYDIAMNVIKHLGIAEYFIYPQINWNPTSASVNKIAQSLNIAIDSIAFIDDMVFERNQVNDVWPQVRTYDASEVNEFIDKFEFDVPVTADSQNRRKMYQEEEHRKMLKNENDNDNVDFLRKCNIKLRVFEPITDEEKLRCYELINRTNQLNMSGKKYSQSEFQDVLAQTNHTNFAFSCSDIYGEYGIIGYGQYRVENGLLIFTECALSCRVAGKYVESALLSSLLKMENCKEGCLTVNKTKKNILLRNTFENIGFSKILDDNNSILYKFTEMLNYSDIVMVNNGLRDSSRRHNGV